MTSARDLGPRLRFAVLGLMAAMALGGCNREMRGTLRDLGIHVDEPTDETHAAPAAPTPAAATAPASAPSAAQASASPTAAVPSTAAASAVAPSAPVAPSASVAPMAPAKPAIPLGDLHSGWIAGTLGEIPRPMLSITPSGSPYGTVQVDFHSTSGNVHDTLRFTTALLKPTPVDVESEHEKSAVFAFNLPVGDYVIDSLRFTDSNDLYQRNCKVEHKLAVPFKVIPGTVNYLGALLTSADWEPGRKGALAPLCGYFVVRDESQRDDPMIRHHYSSLAGPLVVNLLAGNTPDSQKYFRSK